MATTQQPHPRPKQDQAPRPSSCLLLEAGTVQLHSLASVVITAPSAYSVTTTGRSTDHRYYCRCWPLPISAVSIASSHPLQARVIQVPSSASRTVSAHLNRSASQSHDSRNLAIFVSTTSPLSPPTPSDRFHLPRRHSWDAGRAIIPHNLGVCSSITTLAR